MYIYIYQIKFSNKKAIEKNRFLETISIGNKLKIMASKNAAGYDVFLSYQWDVKESVTRLYTQLTETHGLRCWMDDFEIKTYIFIHFKNVHFCPKDY
jgi:hypothetical protein